MSAVPRFGHSSDFSQLFSDNQDDVTDYALGLLFVGAFLSAVFFLWLVIVATFKCIPSTTGFLSGKRFKTQKRAFRVRMAFVLSTFLYILFTILLVTEGITNLQDTIITISNSNQVSNTIMQQQHQHQHQQCVERQCECNVLTRTITMMIYI